MIPARYLANLSIDDWEGGGDARPELARERAAIDREAARVAAIRASLDEVLRAENDPGFPGVRYVGDAFDPSAEFV